jgi:predicted metal-dependent peptidase
MNESGVYTEQYLVGFRERLQQLRTIIKNDQEEGRHPEAVLKYMSKKLDGTGEYAAGVCALTGQRRSSRT